MRTRLIITCVLNCIGLAAVCQVPTLKQVLAPTLKLLDTPKSYRHDFTRKFKPAAGNDTFTINSAVLMKDVDTAFYYKATDDRAEMIRFKDRTGFHIYTTYDSILEVGRPEDPFVYLGYEMADRNLFKHILSIDHRITGIDSVSDPMYSIIYATRERDTFGTTNSTYTLWLNRKTKMIDRYIAECDWMGGHQYTNSQLVAYAFNIPGIEDSINLDKQAFRVKRTIYHDVAVKKRKEREAFLRSLVLDHEAENFKYPTLAGDSLELTALKGSVILLDFTYKACAGCLLAQKTLMEWDEKYSKKGLRVIGVNPFDKDLKKLNEYYQKQGVKYPTVICTEYVADLYRVQAYPTFILIGRDMIVKKIVDGYNEDQMASLGEAIQKLLKE